MQTEERRLFISQQFAQIYGTQPQIWTRAPGRVDLMGSHTDYNLGYVMTMTVEPDTWIAARPRQDRQVCLRSLNIPGDSRFSLDQIERDTRVPWSNYLRGMASMLQKDGCALQGFDGLIHSTIPFGSGLSSSAALEMAGGLVFQQAGGFSLDPVRMALLGQQAENEFVGVRTGILDQYSSAMGQAGCALLLDCRELSSQNVQIASQLLVVICDTRAERNLVGSEYDDRRQQCEQGARLLAGFQPGAQSLRDIRLEQFEAHAGALPEVVARRCRFIIEENQRVLDLAPALQAGDVGRLRALLTASYHGARDLFEIGAPAMEAMFQAASSAPGNVGCRQAGAGFGGCMVALVMRDQVTEFAEHVRQVYETQTGLSPRIFATQASPGAGLL